MLLGEELCYPVFGDLWGRPAKQTCVWRVGDLLYVLEELYDTEPPEPAGLTTPTSLDLLGKCLTCLLKRKELKLEQ